MSAHCRDFGAVPRGAGLHAGQVPTPGPVSGTSHDSGPISGNVLPFGSQGRSERHRVVAGFVTAPSRAPTPTAPPRPGSQFLRQTFHEFATHSIRRSEWARAYYEHLRGDEKKSHHAAVRALAYKWIRIIFRCWKDGKPYDERVYLDSLR